MGTSRSHEIEVIDGAKHTRIAGEEGSTLLAALTTRAERAPEAPCGGRGRCGKCAVRVVRGASGEPASLERRVLGEARIAQGYRLACQVRVTGELAVELSERRELAANILEEGPEYDVAVDPLMRRRAVTISEPALEQQRDDLARLRDALGRGAELPATLDALQALPRAARSGGRIVTVAYDDALRSIEAGDSAAQSYGVAIDLGTTTVVAYLVDLVAGLRIGVSSALNAQREFGDDVISRIHFASRGRDEHARIASVVIRQLNALIRELAASASIRTDAIGSVTLAGNTTMLHLAVGVPPAAIAAAPFTPAFTSAAAFDAARIGLDVARYARVYLLPCVSGYVGADITGAILSSGLAEGDELSLLLDLGTNGEIVLGNRERLVCCSTAAGPAFEGAHIACGTGGVAGAIASVSRVSDGVSWATIGAAPPIGICGSGILDVTALLLRERIVDDTGRMIEPTRARAAGVAQSLAARLSTLDGEPVFVLARRANAPSPPSREDVAVYFGQRDVREVQLAKAAIAAGVGTLVARYGCTLADIRRVYLAGGFGSFLHKESAVRIGLLPAELEGRITVVGNAAGAGAVMCLISRECYERCSAIAERAEYVELSSSPQFNDRYVEEMSFPLP